MANTKETEINLIWNDFIENRSVELRKTIIIKYIWLVKYALQGLNIPSNSLLSEQDFLNIGILGLNEAVERFDNQRGVKFESYAIPRIRGVIRDELRKLDWLSRGARKKVHEFLQAGDSLRSEYGREVSVEEIRRKLNVSEEEYRSYLNAAAVASASYSFSLNESANVSTIDGEEINLIEELPDESQESALNKIANDERIAFITQYLKRLVEKKRLVLSLYYYENLTFKEIGAQLSISEGRVSQIHTEALNELRSRLREFENA